MKQTELFEQASLLPHQLLPSERAQREPRLCEQIVELPNVSGVHFRHVPGFPGYCVGDDGSLFSKRHANGRPSPSWRVMRPGISPKGYRVAVISRQDGSRFAIRMSRLILCVFSGEPTRDSQACHGDGNRVNDALENLRWDSASGNQQDRLKHGTDSRGEKSGRARFTELQVMEIRARLSAGELGTTIATEFGCPVQTIYTIKHRRNWRHI